MELYKLPRGSLFKLLEKPKVPPDAISGDLNMAYKLKNIDGMYSYCTDTEGTVYHFAAWTEVEKVEND